MLYLVNIHSQLVVNSRVATFPLNLALQVKSRTKMTKGADQLELYDPLGYACRVMVSFIPKLIIIVSIELHTLYTLCTVIAMYVLASAFACCMLVA